MSENRVAVKAKACALKDEHASWKNWQMDTVYKHVGYKIYQKLSAEERNTYRLKASVGGSFGV
eukprot:12912517-Prorocentrum_lima.AAC.1